MHETGRRDARAGDTRSTALRLGPDASSRILIAGIGSVSFGDEGFGSEVLQQLQRLRRARPELLPDGLRLLDCGVRALRLAYVLAGALERVLLIDATARGGRPGTLYLLDVDTDRAPLELAPPLPSDARPGALDLEATFATARWLAARRLPPVQMLGCEPASLSGTELSGAVRAAVGPAVEIVQRWLQEGGQV
jgi:hydrogenase maturation protease